MLAIIESITYIAIYVSIAIMVLILTLVVIGMAFDRPGTWL